MQFFIKSFILLVPILYSSLYLVYSTGHCSLTCALHLKDVLFSNVLPNLLFWFHPIRVSGFHFLSIYGQTYLIFRFNLVLLLFSVPHALLFVGGMYHFCILYYSCKGWNIYNTWSCCILLELVRSYKKKIHILCYTWSILDIVHSLCRYKDLLWRCHLRNSKPF